MQWLLSETEVANLLNCDFKQWIVGPKIKAIDNNNWYLIIYPKGYAEETRNEYVEIFLICEEYKIVNNKDSKLKLEIGLECNAFNAVWSEIIDIDTLKSKKISHRLDRCIPTKKLKYRSSREIIFDLNIKVLDKLKNSINYEEKDDTFDNINCRKNQRIIRKYNDNTIMYKWKIPEVMMGKFLSTPNGKIQSSPIFEIGGSRFQFVIFPNGTNQTYYNSVALYIQLIEWNESINAMTLLYDVNVIECNITCSGCLVFGDPRGGINNNKTNGNNNYNKFRFHCIDSKSIWSKYTVQCDQIRSLPALTMEFYFKITRASYKQLLLSNINDMRNSDDNNNDDIIDPLDVSMGWLNVERPWTMKEDIAYKWTIYASQFRNAVCEKTINSPRFEQWRMHFYPNGFNKPNFGKMQLDLYLNAVCSPIYYVTINVMIKCNQLNFMSVHKNVEFCIGNLRFGFDELSTINANCLNKLSTLTFEINIKIISLHDRNRNQIILKSDDHTDSNQEKLMLADCMEKLNVLRQRMDEQNDIINELKDKYRFTQQLLNDNKYKNNESNGNMIKKWLVNIVGLDYHDLFVKDGWDNFECIKVMTEKDLIDIGISKRGHRVRILQHIFKLDL